MLSQHTDEVLREVLGYDEQRIEVARAVVFRGEAVQADLFAKSQYGAVLAGRPIEVRLPDGRTLRDKTDEAGKFQVEFPTEGFGEDQPLEINASLPQDGVSAKAVVRMAVLAFRIDLNTDRSVYLDGELFPLRVKAIDPLGKPVAQALNVSPASGS